MKGRRTLALLLGVLLLAAGCRAGGEGSTRPLADAAADLDAELGRVREAVVELARAAAERLGNPARYAAPRFPGRTYRTFEGGLTYYQGGAGESAAVLIQPTPAPEELLGRLRLMEHLDDALRRVVGTSPLVAMAWSTTGDGAAVFHPGFDLVAYIPPGLDVAADILPYRAAAPAANPGRAPVWVEPYVDITGKGYMVTVSAPVHLGAEMVAVAGADVAVGRVARLFLPRGGGLRLLLTGTGFLVGATEPIAQALGIEALGRVYYLDQVLQDAAAPERFNLARHPSPAVRELATRVLAGEDGFPLVAGGRRYRVAAAAVPAAGWFLAELEELR